MSILYGLPFERYQSLPGLSASGLKEFAKSPAHYQYWLKNGGKTSKAMEIGSLLHTMVLEPNKLYEQYAFFDGERRMGKAYEGFYHEHKAKIILLKRDLVECQAIANAVLNNLEVRRLLSEGQAEVSMTWENGVNGKGRIDYLHPSHILIDLKFVEDASPTGFAKSFYNYKWHWQAYWYMIGYELSTGIRPAAFKFIAVEKKAPHIMSLYWVTDFYLELAAQQITPILKLYKRCELSGEWPGYPFGEIEILPWAYRDAEALAMEEY